MNENNITKAEEWFEKAKHDFESAKLILEGNGYADTAAVLLQQAMEKYLKGFLIKNGWKLIKTHNLKVLLDEAEMRDNNFERFQDLAGKLTQYYIDEKYPTMTTDIDLEEAKTLCAQVQELLKLIK